MHRWVERAGLRVHQAGDAFHVDLPVRWGDLDAHGRVKNSVWFDYLQDARVDFLLAGNVPRMLTDGVLAVGHTMSFRAPLRWSQEPVRVHVVMLDRGRARFRVGYLITHADQVCAVAASTMVPFDLASQRPRRILPEEASFFDRFAWHLEPPFRELPRPSLHGAGHVLPVQTRWSDIDRQDHVNNVRMLDFFQESQVVLTSDADDHGRGPWVLAQQEVEYVNQMGFRREPYQVATAVTRLGRTSLSVASELVDPAASAAHPLVARCRMALVRVDEQGQPTPIPQDVRDRLAPYLVSAD